MARMVSSIYGWAAGSPPVTKTDDFTPTRLRHAGKPTPFLDTLLERQDKILSGKNLDDTMRPSKRTIESCATYAYNKAKLNRSDPFEYGRSRAHAKAGLV